MKLTWFGGTTIRIHIGGAILVVDAEQAPPGIDRAELVSGADSVIAGFGANLPNVDLATWKPRKPARLLDEGVELPPVDAWTAGTGVILIDALGEAPLLLLAANTPLLGRWAESGVMTLFGSGERLAELGAALLAASPPRLIALAGNEAAIDVAIPALAPLLEETGLLSLEAGLALEI